MKKNDVEYLFCFIMHHFAISTKIRKMPGQLHNLSITLKQSGCHKVLHFTLFLVSTINLHFAVFLTSLTFQSLSSLINKDQIQSSCTR